MTRNQPANHTPAAERTNGDSDCTAALTALANGDLNGWRGLPERCTERDVEKVLSPATSRANESSPYSGPRGYAPTPAAPHGLTFHYNVGVVEYVTVVAPRLTRPVQEMLGEPEDKIPSYLEGSSEQWVYAGLGLAFHMKLEEPGVRWLYVFCPTTTETYKTSLLGSIRTLRHRIP